MGRKAMILRTWGGSGRKKDLSDEVRRVVYFDDLEVTLYIPKAFLYSMRSVVFIYVCISVCTRGSTYFRFRWA